MATIKAFIRTKKKDKETFIRFRISDGRNIQLYHVSELKILPSLWDESSIRLNALLGRMNAYGLIQLLQSARSCFLHFTIQHPA